MSSSELADWRAYDQLEPIGANVDRQLWGETTAAIYNVNMVKGARRLTGADFVPRYETQKTRTPGEIYKAIKGFLTNGNTRNASGETDR